MQKLDASAFLQRVPVAYVNALLESYFYYDIKRFDSLNSCSGT